MPNIHKLIWGKFGIKHGDIYPYSGGPWNTTGSRVTLAETMAELGFKIGAEIGVEKGHYSRVLCDTIPDLKLYCVDPWMPYGRNSQGREDYLYVKAQQRLAGRNVEIMKMTSVEAAKQIENGSLDFVYIDALHDFDNVMMDIIAWAPKVKSGGIVSGHDYIILYNCGVMPAVNAYVHAHNISPLYVTAHQPEYISWFFVKP